jgi:hypothetical protein
LRLTSPFNLPAPGRRQTLYVVFDLAESCVFSKQSLGPLYCNSFTLRGRTPTRDRAPLLPKLRGQVAEFLNEGSHLRLRIFSSPTCVGLRYGYPKNSLEAFLGSVASATLCALRRSLRALRIDDPPDLPGGSPYTLNRHFQSPARIASCVPPSYKRSSGSSGMLTGPPSATPFGLALGPD